MNWESAHLNILDWFHVSCRSNMDKNLLPKFRGREKGKGHQNVHFPSIEEENNHILRDMSAQDVSEHLDFGAR